MNTKTLILAAGRGERMRPLTDHTPKPLLQVRGKPLMQWAMEGLARGGFTDFVVNTAWLGEHISTYFGATFGIQPAYLLPKQLLKSEQKNNNSVIVIPTKAATLVVRWRRRVALFERYRCCAIQIRTTCFGC
jgi:NDP-sugar pyrophosphorylase family protein